jgi:plastocyanin
MKTFTYFKKSTFKFTFALIVFFAFQQINAQVKHVVQVSNTTFTPADITISVGDTIEWQNTEGFHNVNGNQTAYTANPESFGNSTGNGWTYQHVFTIAGTYDYHCDPHVNLGMIGKVHVTSSYKKYIVEVTKNVFTPNELKINPGDTVEWRNIDGFHNVNGTQATYAMNPESFGNTTGVGWTFSHVFNAEGKYDYQCDPHVGLGMIGKIEVGDTGVIVDGKKMLTINFSGMNPHVGQTLWLSVTEKDSGKEIERRMETIAVDFSMQVSGLEMGHSYNIDFFADHNGNGSYDAPPADHAWRMELDNVVADTMLTFMHNTNFTDIGLNTGIQDLLYANIKMYPNPARNVITIETSDFESSELQVLIRDISGKTQLSVQKSFSGKTEVDIHSLSNGIYFVELRNSSQRTMMKLVKNK